jgi:hypothetical protein
MHALIFVPQIGVDRQGPSGQQVPPSWCSLLQRQAGTQTTLQVLAAGCILRGDRRIWQSENIPPTPMMRTIRRRSVLLHRPFRRSSLLWEIPEVPMTPPICSTCGANTKANNVPPPGPWSPRPHPVPAEAHLPTVENCLRTSSEISAVLTISDGCCCSSDRRANKYIPIKKDCSAIPPRRGVRWGLSNSVCPRPP